MIITKLRNYFIYVSKISGILFCLYFIYNYDIYKIAFNIPNWMRDYTPMGPLNNFLDYLGIAILIIPLTVMVLSMLFPERKLLHFISVIFSVSTNIFSLAIAFMRGTLQDFMNLKIFTVYHIASFEEKKIAFLAIISKKREEMNLSLEKQNYIQEKLNSFHELYESNIRSTTLSQIPKYAEDLLVKLTKEAEKMPIKSRQNLSNSNGIQEYISIPAIIKIGLIDPPSLVITKEDNGTRSVKIHVENLYKVPKGY